MVVGKEDLGLTLSLACSTTNITTTSTPPITPSTTNITPSHITPITTNNNNNNQHNMGFLMMMNRNNNHINNPNNNPNLKKISSNPPLQLNLMMTPSINSSNSTPPPSFLQKLHRYRSTDSFPPSDKSTDSGRLFLRGIDVNRPAGGGGGGGGGGEEEEAGVSSPNSTVSTLSGGKRSRDSGNGGPDEMEVERAESRGGVSDDGEDDGDGDGDVGENSRKKLRLTKDQSAILEESFKEHNTLNPKQKLALAKRLGLRPRQVEVWFQNRRARTKLKQTEVDCEFLKRCCEQLTEENRRLQKEVQELRTLKLSPQFYMQMTPPTTLTMCPSCERVAVPPSSSSAPHSKPLSIPDPRANPNHRVSPWVNSPVPIRSFDPLHPRS